MRNGFTLLEVLVSVVLVGLTVTAFFQLLSGSLQLEHKVQEKVGLPVIAKQAFDRLMDLDVTDEEFPWEGQAAGHAYEFRLHPVALQPDEEDVVDTEINIVLPQELFAFEMLFYEDEARKKAIRLVRYQGYPPGRFSEDFLNEHLQPPGELQ